MTERPHSIHLSSPLPLLKRGLLLQLAAALFVLWLCAARAHAQPPSLAQQVQSQVQAQLGHTQAAVEVGAIDARLAAQTCQDLDVLVPAAHRLRGKVQVGLRCTTPQAWATWVPVTVTVSGTYWVAARPLPAGTALQSGDLAQRTGDLQALPADAVAQPDAAIGQVLMRRVEQDQPVQLSALRRQVAVMAGQTVKLLVNGGTFQISSDGRALNQALQGQIAQVRTASGSVISGVAQPGGVVLVQN